MYNVHLSTIIYRDKHVRCIVSIFGIYTLIRIVQFTVYRAEPAN